MKGDLMSIAAMLLHQVVFLASNTTTTAAKKSSGSSIIILLVLVGVGGYFLLIRPQKRKARKQRDQLSDIHVGDEVLTVGGTVGRLVAIDADRFTIVTGEEVEGFAARDGQPSRLTFVRNALARKIEPTIPPRDDTSTGSTEDGTK